MKIWKCMYEDCGWAGTNPRVEERSCYAYSCPRCGWQAFHLDEKSVMLEDWPDKSDILTIKLDYHTANNLGIILCRLSEKGLKEIEEKYPETHQLLQFLEEVATDAFRRTEKDG